MHFLHHLVLIQQQAMLQLELWQQLVVNLAVEVDFLTPPERCCEQHRTCRQDASNLDHLPLRMVDTQSPEAITFAGDVSRDSAQQLPRRERF